MSWQSLIYIKQIFQLISESSRRIRRLRRQIFSCDRVQAVRRQRTIAATSTCEWRPGGGTKDDSRIFPEDVHARPVGGGAAEEPIKSQSPHF